jgi:hypothetical protein
MSTQKKKKDTEEKLDADQALDTPSPQMISPEKLRLDPENPRLAQYNLGTKVTDDELLLEIWKRMACSEIALSIVHDKYWQHEPLFAIEEKQGTYIVIEGNRRLAAIKALLNVELLRKVAGDAFPVPTPKVLDSLKELPVIVVKDRLTVWKYLGFKHVNGPAKWGSYAKAQYIAFVKSSGVPLSEIANQIGDTNRTVQRLYRAYMVIEQAEKSKKWKRENAYKKQLSFSHMMTGLDYEGIADFIEISDKSEETANPVPEDKLENLQLLCEWLWGDSRSGTPPVVQSQNPDLRNLNQVLLSTSATQRLIKDRRLDIALEESKGDPVIFASALSDARTAISKAQSRVSNGFNGESSLIEITREIARSSVDLLETMRSKAARPDDLMKRIEG